MDDAKLEKFQKSTEGEEVVVVGDDFSKVKFPPFAGEDPFGVNVDGTVMTNEGDVVPADKEKFELTERDREVLGLVDPTIKESGQTPEQEQAPVEIGANPAESVDADNPNYSKELAGALAATKILDLDGPAKELGVDTVARVIGDFDVAKPGNLKERLYDELGYKTAVAKEEVRREGREVAKAERESLAQENDVAAAEIDENYAREMIREMKALINWVRSGDPRFNKLREEAERAGKDVFVYAAEKDGGQGLMTDAIRTLSKELSKNDEEPQAEAPPEEDTIEIKSETYNRTEGENDGEQFVVQH